MALFAAGSSVSLLLVPLLYDKLRGRGNQLRQDRGTRAAGGLLVLAAALGAVGRCVSPLRRVVPHRWPLPSAGRDQGRVVR